jgi:transposase
LQLRNLTLTAPEDLREALRDLTIKQLVIHCARWHRRQPVGALSATWQALRVLARRHQSLDAEIAELDADILRLTRQAAPRLLKQAGIGPETASRLLIVAGDNPGRLRSDAALAALCGASPVEASSGKTIRYRLNRGGDRQGNNALWTIATNHMIHHPKHAPTSSDAPPKARPPKRSDAASCAPSPAASTHSSSPTSTTPKPPQRSPAAP